MTKKNDVVVVATLFNGRDVIVEPDYSTKKCAYRYLTEVESKTMKLDTNGQYIWQEVPIYTTDENGETLIFVTIDVTPVVLGRFKTSKG